jgi:uncharacterized protein (DUF433 family)
VTSMTLNDFIAIDAGYCGGRPRIAGRRVRVQDIAAWHLEHGLSVDEIVAEFELSKAAVHAGLAYYFAHQDEIDEAIRRDDALVAELQAKTPSQLRDLLDE